MINSLRLPEAGTAKNKFAVIILWLMAYISLFSFSLNLNAQEPKGSDPSKARVAYAGLALLGSHAHTDKNFPFSAPIATEINRALYQRVKGVSPDHYYLYTDELLDSDKGSAVSLAFVIDQEKASLEELAGVHKLLIEASGQIIVFDFDERERSIIASYPVSLKPYIQVFKSRPSPAVIADYVRKYYLGGLENMNQGLISKVADKIEQLPIERKFEKEVGMGQVEISSQFKTAMPAADKLFIKQVKFAYGRQLASSLANTQNLSVIPASAESSLAKMAIQFTGDRSTSFLNLPETEYEIGLNILGADVKVHKQAADGRVLIYYVVAELSLRDTLANETLFKQQVRQATSKLIPTSQNKIDHWSAVDDTVRALLQNFSQQLDKPTKDWKKQQNLKSEDLKQYKQFAGVIEECR